MYASLNMQNSLNTIIIIGVISTDLNQRKSHSIVLKVK